jgi:hypothetical protein
MNLSKKLFYGPVKYMYECLVLCGQRYVSKKVEVPTGAFMGRENAVGDEMSFPGLK